MEASLSRGSETDGARAATSPRVDTATIPRPPTPEWDISEPDPAWFGPLRRSAKRIALGVVDRGWFGLIPLDTHLVICGFPRSGSTLLQVMIEHCLSGAKVFSRETRGLRMAHYALRNRAVMITKRPRDIFWMDDIRAFYARQRAKARFVLTVRDPRAVLTSYHRGWEARGYYLTPTQWRAHYEHYRYARQFDDTVLVEYADLVCDPREIQQRLSEFAGCAIARPFDQFHLVASRDRIALNGLRPLDKSSIDKWRDPTSRDHIRRLLQEIPDLPDCLIDMGYERDTRWTRDYA
jgi:hypothetical protein